MKEEINHSLAWAVDLPARGFFIVTPGTLTFHDPQNKGDSRFGRSLNGKKSPYKLNDQDLEVARLAFLFSLERRDMMDEKAWKENKVYDQVSNIYEKLGIKDLLKDLKPGGPIPASFLDGEPEILEHFKEIVGQSQGNRKKGDGTLAFHIVTTPVISRV